MKLSIIFVIMMLFMISCVQQQSSPHGDFQVEDNNAQTLKNGDTSEIDAQEVNYGKATGFLAKPKEGNYPGIVMIHEWWGLNENIKDMARQLAAEGYVVLAVDLFGEVAQDAAKARELSSNVRNNPGKAIQNLKSAVEFLKNENTNTIGSLGWCFGGGMSLQLALNEELDSTVIYYGNLETDTEKLSSIDWPILGIFGDQDTAIPVSSVNEFEESLNEIGIEPEIYIYEGVGHAFANPSGGNYAPEETKDAWEKTLDFLERSLKK